MRAGRIALIGVFGIVGWALCGSIIFVGREVTTIDNALVVHAIGAPIVFGILSWIYFSRFNYTTPPWTAVVFTGIVITLDVIVVALLIERSFEMFGSVLGTWLPWVLIFASTYLTGNYVTTRPGALRRT